MDVTLFTNNVSSIFNKTLDIAQVKIKKKMVSTTQTENKPWFDSDCKLTKKSLVAATKNIRSDPKNIGFREIVNTTRKKYKKLVAH